MASFVTLDKLVHAMASAISEAQHLVEKVQIENIKSFFNQKNNSPEYFEIDLPSVRSNAVVGESDCYRVPLVSLIPHSSLIISEAEIHLDVEMSGLSYDSSDDTSGKTDVQKPTPKKPSLMVNPEAGIAKKTNGSVAHITLKLVMNDPSEGMSRLLTEVIKTQGFITVRDLAK